MPDDSPLLGGADVPDQSTAGEVEPSVPAAGVAWWLVGAAVCAAAALGIVVGVKVGRAVSQPLPDQKVQFVPVERCADCEQRKLAEVAARNGDFHAEAERLVQMQEDVERATEL